MPVQIIKATKQVHSNAEINTVLPVQQKLRVAAYCRVSTDSDEQETSYEAQCRYYKEHIKSNPSWKLAGIYADEGITGTSTKRREQFNKMIDDCEAGLIDMVITKSISRWARNTIDSLKSIRKLRDLGIPILFEKESINTLETNGEILITIMSSLAQQESESISKNVKMGIRYLFQQGKGRLNTAQFLGLARDKDTKTLVIIPEEAALVRRIYREYLEGLSPGMIASRLTQDGILTPAGKNKWYQSTIVSILENEKYCGDLLMQKYYVADFLTHKIEKNNGVLPQYYVENAHEPIIPKTVYYRVQGEMRRRGLLKNDPSKIRFGSSNALSQRLFCGHCGRTLKRYVNPDPSKTDWRCRKRAYEKKSITKEVEALCPCRNVREKEIKRAIVKAFNRLPEMRDELIRMHGAIWKGELKRIDSALESMKDQIGRLSERLNKITAGRCDCDHSKAAGNETQSVGRCDCDHSKAISQDRLSETELSNEMNKDRCIQESDKMNEFQFLNNEIKRAEMEYRTLVFERAEKANNEVQIRILLELIDIMAEKNNGAEVYDSAACYDYDEFFRRTRFVPDEGVLGNDGRIRKFSDDMVIRYLKSVTIQDDAYEVYFKCGISVKVDIK